MSPFCIGLWIGNGHPKSSELLLEDFGEELIRLQTEPIQVGQNKHNKKVVLRSIICDAPAKAFVKNIKNHNSFVGCNECDQIGFRIEHTPIYQISSGNLRTDKGFKCRLDKNHHHTQSETVLEKAGVKMVSQFPHDPMHLVDLGVAKKLLIYILELVPKKCHDDISAKFISLGKYVPSEFARKPRGITEIARWKATEFRFFIFYSGIVILKNIIPDSNYYHLLLLTTALRLMNDPINCQEYVDNWIQLKH